MPLRSPICALVVSDDPETLRTVEAAITSRGDRAVAVMDLADAVARAGSAEPALAFVDVTLAGGAGLALVHHLPVVWPDVVVYVMAPAPKLHLALEGLTLGATGMLTLPPSGDAVLRAVDEVRSRIAAASEQTKIGIELSTQRRRGDHMNRLVRIAAKAGWTELARMLAEALAELTQAKAVSVYRDEGSEGALCRAAIVGEAAAPEHAAALSDLETYGCAFSLGPGALVVEGGSDSRRGLAAELAEFATAVLALAGHLRPVGGEDTTTDEPFPRFEKLAVREVEKARRHERQVTFAAIKLRDPDAPPVPNVDDRVRTLVREGDVLGRDESGEEILLMLPDTGALGGQIFRRRVGLRAFGLATFPRDGMTSERLVRLARQRSEESFRSPVRALGLAQKSVREIIDALLATPMLDAGLGSSYPLDLPYSAALSLVEHACREARRGGAVLIVVAAQKRVCFTSAVHKACGTDSKVTVVHVDLPPSPATESIELVVAAAEHGSWLCCGITERERLRAVHATDAMLGDLLVRKVVEAAEKKGVSSRDG